MAFDPPYVDVAKIFIDIHPALIFYPMEGDTEREIKKKIIPKQISNIHLLSPSNDAAVECGANQIISLLGALKQNSEIWFDPQGSIPNNYVLASLNVDTVEGTVPTARMRNEGWQCRIRKPLWVHDESQEFPYDLMLRQMDANMKTFLSGKKRGQHRLELEQIIEEHPSSFFREFKSATDLPDFTKDIEDRHLRVSDICMTSRTGFYFVMKVPNSDSYALFHATYDATQFTTSHADIFTEKKLRLELEIEAKGVIAKAGQNFTADEQDVLINRIFDVIHEEAAPLGMEDFRLSKLEHATQSVSAHFRDHAISQSRFKEHLLKNGVNFISAGSPSIQELWALATGKSVRSIVQDLKYNGHDANLARLAREMPNPLTMLDLSIGARHLIAA